MTEDSKKQFRTVSEVKQLEERRSRTVRAMRKVFEKFQDLYFDEYETVLEVGSGTGFLRRNWPEDERKWIELDIQGDALEEAKNERPEGDYVQGSIYSLPFREESVDVVCSLTTYTDFEDLDKAVGESWRVLKPNGLFLHLLDMRPNTGEVKNHLTKDGKLPMRTEVEGKNVRKREIIPEENLKEFEEEMKPFYDEFGLGERELRKEEEQIWEEYRKEVDCADYFNELLFETLCSYFSSENVEIGKETAKYKGGRTEEQRQRPRDPFLFPSPLYDNPDKIPLSEVNISSAKSLAYDILKPISSSLARKVEPDAIEWSEVQYVKAEK